MAMLHWTMLLNVGEGRKKGEGFKQQTKMNTKIHIRGR